MSKATAWCSPMLLGCCSLAIRSLIFRNRRLHYLCEGGEVISFVAISAYWLAVRQRIVAPSTRRLSTGNAPRYYRLVPACAYLTARSAMDAINIRLTDRPDPFFFHHSSERGRLHFKRERNRPSHYGAGSDV